MRDKLRKITRAVFGVNSAYLSISGVMALLAPAWTIELYGGLPSDASSLYLRALFRMIGAFLVFAGYISARVARDPDESPQLLRLMTGLSALTLLCWTLALGAGDVTFGQVAVDFFLQIPVLGAAALYYPFARDRGTAKREGEKEGEGEGEGEPAAGREPRADAALPPVDPLRELEQQELERALRSRDLEEFDRQMAEALARKERGGR